MQTLVKSHEGPLKRMSPSRAAEAHMPQARFLAPSEPQPNSWFWGGEAVLGNAQRAIGRSRPISKTETPTPHTRRPQPHPPETLEAPNILRFEMNSEYEELSSFGGDEDDCRASLRDV